MIRRALVAGAAAVAGTVSTRWAFRRAGRRLLDAPRTGPDEAALAPEIDALGGEVVRLRSRDGLRLSARWLPAEQPPDGSWTPDPHEAIVLLHGWSGSIAPDLVEYGPFLRRTAAVLGLDFRGHGGSDPAPTTFGARETEDVAGALDWLAERGVRSVALFGTSMGGVTAIASVVVLGDGTLAAADAEPFAPAPAPDSAPRPRVVAVVADSVPGRLASAVAGRLRRRVPGPIARVVADRMFAGAAVELGVDPRDTEPIRVVPLVAPVPLLLIHGDADATVDLGDARRLAEAAGPTVDHWVIAHAEHARGHSLDPVAYEDRVTVFLRRAFDEAREAARILAGGGGDPSATTVRDDS